MLNQNVVDAVESLPEVRKLPIDIREKIVDAVFWVLADNRKDPE